MKRKFTTFMVMMIALLLCAMLSKTAVAAEGVPKADPTGATIGTSYDVPSAQAGKPTLDEVAAQVGKNKLGINYVWILLTGCLIFFFQAGFAMVETGFTRAKHAMHTMAMNFAVFIVGTIGFYVIGFALMFGGSGGVASLGASTGVLNHEFELGNFGLFGTKGFLLSSGGVYDVGVFALFFFQMVFMDTTCTIPTGSMAERVKMSAVVASSFFVSTIFYPLFGNWVWGGGWLSQLGKNFGLGHGVVDFAGSAVVHSMGGMMALSGAIILGPRIGKFKKDGTPVTIAGHDIPMAVIGTIILFFGWFAFNAGSTLNGTDFRIAVVVTNTMLAGAAGGFTAMMYMWKKTGKPDPAMTCNGALSGLVAITAPCAFVNSMSAFAIGIVAGFLVCAATWFVEHKLKIDDPVGAVAVHCVNGLWGVISLGIFADGTYGDGLNGIAGGVRGLLYGDSSQLIAQLICAGVLVVWGFGSSFIFWKVLDKFIGIRVNSKDEIRGLDMPEMGMLAYPEFRLVEADSVYEEFDFEVINKEKAEINEEIELEESVS